MAINFPDSPNNGDSFTSNNKTWVFDGTVWNITSGTNSVADGAITAAKLASNAVHQTKLASNLSGITITTTANRDTDITSPFTGQFAFLTDTNAFIRWNGSAWVTAIVTVPTEAPTSLTLDSATKTTATISFAAGADGGSAITNYQYALSTNGGSSYGSYNALNPADATSPITITGLSIGTAYYIKLKAVNAQGASTVESNALSFSTAGLSVEYLVVAGGGGGGGGESSNGFGGGGGGGGAGGFRTSVSGATSGGGSAAESPLNLVAGTYTVTIGAGGTGGASAFGDSSSPGSVGSNSVFHTITSAGGGYGGADGSGTGGSGGSGGGGGGDVGGGNGAGTAGQGYAGGTSSNRTGGGGGGAGEIGSTDAVSEGGDGLSSSITGSAVFYAGGGGGGSGSASTTTRSGGTGGGGNGSSTNGTSSSNVGDGTATAGTANTGGGGGGAAAGRAQSGQNGGSGIVIVRYLTADASSYTITGGTATTSGSYTVRTFLASGSLVIS